MLSLLVDDPYPGKHMLRAMERSSHLATLFGLDGRVAAVTGAASGLGREVARAFAEAGAEVIALDRDGEALAGLGREFHSIEVDVAVPESVEAAFDVIPRVDVLVNAAGVGGWGPTEAYPDEVWRRVIDVNLTGTFTCCRVAGGRMLASGSGSIVNIASTLGLVGFPGTIAYVASKGGVVQLTRALAVEWAARGVRVNAIAPSTFETELVRGNRPERPQVYERLLDLTPAQRFGEPHEIVGPALFLASAASSMVTGHVLAVDGGYTAQ
jgi:NAD(P)-dependent dehydrogenase (short-subunit alcohol dehydrogenase family)